MLTLWEMTDAVRTFAGEHPEGPGLEPQGAAAALVQFDETARHNEILVAPEAD